jgi:hypothetical protein
MPFSRPSGDLGGFHEVIEPRAFSKTLQESRAVAGIGSVSTQGIRFNSGAPVSVSLNVLRDRWLLNHTGEIRREVLEVRLIEITDGACSVVVSRQAQAIAAGVARDFAPLGETA